MERAIIKKVPTATLTAMHCAGFHLYDAQIQNIEQVNALPPPVTDFGPHKSASETEVGDAFSLAAGPLPAEASPAACTYEWTLHTRFPSENDMYKFVAMLRQCSRMDHFSQANRIAQHKAMQEAAPPLVADNVRKYSTGGQLEVVLVEARRLTSHGAMEAASKIQEAVFFHKKNRLDNLQAVTSGEESRSTPVGADINTFVNFRMLSDGKYISLRNQKVQSSPVIENTGSPCWATQFPRDGGFVFKTGHIDPDAIPDLCMEFEVMQFSVGFTKRIGAVQCGVNARPVLTNPQEPFKNLWLPLITQSEDGGALTNKTGEIHIMTRWLPASKLNLPPGQQNMSVRSEFLKEIWPKVTLNESRSPSTRLKRSSSPTIQTLCVAPRIQSTLCVERDTDSREARLAESAC